MIVGGLWRTPRYSALSRLESISALRAADHVQQTRLAGPAHPHAHGVVTAVQRTYRAFQRDTVLRGGQRIAVGAHHDPLATTAAYPKCWWSARIPNVRYSFGRTVRFVWARGYTTVSDSLRLLRECGLGPR